MAYSPVDPMSLQGETLRRWYLRSPDEVERERQTAQAQKYEAFFGGGQPASQALRSENHPLPPAGAAFQASPPQPLWVATGPNRWSSRPASSPSFSSANNLRSARASFQASSCKGSCQEASPNRGICAACHGPAIPPPPPVMANPPDWPRWTPGPNMTPRKPSKPHPSQCAQQNMNDSRICSREVGAWQSVCLRSAADREAHCIASDGEVGWPPLQTHHRR